MSAQSLVGQSLSSRASRISVFGGLEDRFVVVDSLTGRVVDVATSGRTVLFPWSVDKFISIRGLLGRESLVTIELREHADPGRVRDTVVAGDLPAPVGEVWGHVARLIPGVYPIVYQLGAGLAAQLELTAELPEGGPGSMGFVPGVYDHRVGATAGGEVAAVIDVSGSASRLDIPLRTAVGHRDTIWAAAEEALWIASNGVATAIPMLPRQNPPTFIDHDPVAGTVLIGYWRRWASQGGPATDVLVFEEEGELIASGSFDRLTRRAALAESTLTTFDIEGHAAATTLQRR